MEGYSVGALVAAHLAALLVGAGDDGGVEDVRVGEQEGLELGGGHLFGGARAPQGGGRWQRT